MAYVKRSKAEYKKKDNHGYYELHVTYGQKPEAK